MFASTHFRSLLSQAITLRVLSTSIVPFRFSLFEFKRLVSFQVVTASEKNHFAQARFNSLKTLEFNEVIKSRDGCLEHFGPKGSLPSCCVEKILRVTVDNISGFTLLLTLEFGNFAIFFDYMDGLRGWESPVQFVTEASHPETFASQVKRFSSFFDSPNAEQLFPMQDEVSLESALNSGSLDDPIYNPFHYFQ